MKVDDKEDGDEPAPAVPSSDDEDEPPPPAPHDDDEPVCGMTVSHTTVPFTQCVSLCVSCSPRPHRTNMNTTKQLQSHHPLFHHNHDHRPHRSLPPLNVLRLLQRQRKRKPRPQPKL